LDDKYWSNATITRKAKILPLATNLRRLRTL
jgi:hypothetical protein